MSLAELQVLVDDLAERLGAPILLEDVEQRVIVYSAGHDQLDEIRQATILRREIPAEVRAWTQRLGVFSAREPVRVRLPEALAPGYLGRLGVPARYGQTVMGVLWLIDDEQRLTPQEVDEAMRAGQRAALLLYEEQLSHRLHGEVLAHLLSPMDELRDAAVVQLADEGFPEAEPTVVGVVQVIGTTDLNVTTALSYGLTEARLRDDHRRSLFLTRPDHGVILSWVHRPHDDREALRTVQAAVHAVRHALGGAVVRVVAGLGDTRPRLAEALTSYQQARLASRVAAAAPTLGDLLRWRDLGAFRALVQLHETELGREALDPRLLPLLAEHHRELLRTAEAYLDLAGNVQRAAALLHLHRGTLYYRLGRVRALTGFDFDDGMDRLALHLGLKLARIRGLLPPSPTS